MESNGTNGEIKRYHAYIGVLREVWDTFGLPTLLLVFFLSVWTGWVPSPLTEAKEVIEKHAALVEAHVAHDDEILFYLKTMCQSNAKLAGLPMEDCNWRPHSH